MSLNYTNGLQAAYELSDEVIVFYVEITSNGKILDEIGEDGKPRRVVIKEFVNDFAGRASASSFYPVLQTICNMFTVDPEAAEHLQAILLRLGNLSCSDSECTLVATVTSLEQTRLVLSDGCGYVVTPQVSTQPCESTEDFWNEVCRLGDPFGYDALFLHVRSTHGRDGQAAAVPPPEADIKVEVDDSARPRLAQAPRQDDNAEET